MRLQTARIRDEEVATLDRGGTLDKLRQLSLYYATGDTMTRHEELRILRHLRSGAGAGSLVDVVRRGLPTSKALAFVRTLMPAIPKEVVLRAAGISKRTLERRHGGRLGTDQSDRLARIARIVDFANDAIGSEDQAVAWLGEPNRALGGRAPIELLDTDAGAHRVETVLGRLREGSFA